MSEDPPPGWRIQTHDTLASTQDAAIEAAKSGDCGRLAILAAEQTAGRGSRGRSWTGGAENLHFSALFRPNAMPPQPGFWALMAGISLHDAVAPHVPDVSALKLKWPNDLLYQGGKLGGILIDSAITADCVLDWVVIGLGVNIRVAPAIDGRVTTALPGAGVAPASLAGAILHNFDRWIGCPFHALRDAWLDRAQPIGTWLTIAIGGHAQSGAFAGLADDGALLLSGHAAPIATGEVFATRAPSGAGES